MMLSLSTSNRRPALFSAILVLVLLSAAVTAISIEDESGAVMRAGMVLASAGLGLVLPWRLALPVAAVIWLGPNYMRSVLDDRDLFDKYMLMEVPGLLGVALASAFVRSLVAGGQADFSLDGMQADRETGLYDERAMLPALEAELARARRFERRFALVLVGIDERHQRYAFRDESEWQAGYIATARLLRRTRANIDRVYRYGSSGFALILPESGENEVTGLVRRLRKTATSTKPREGEPGGPLPVAFGATFYPNAASSVEDLLRRAEIALRVAARNSTRLQLDTAEAPAPPPPHTFRQPEPEAAQPVTIDDAGRSDRPADAGNAVTAEEPPAPVLANGSLADASGSIIPFTPRSPQSESNPMSEEELAGLLNRLDETLGLIRELRSQAS
jgi:diguanylate cyclase (GGDEF)-like protein